MIGGSRDGVENLGVELTVHDDFVLIVYEVKSQGSTLQDYGQKYTLVRSIFFTFFKILKNYNFDYQYFSVIKKVSLR